MRLTVAQKIAVIENEFLGEELELALRTNLLHESNHRDRGREFSVQPVPESFRLANLEWLLNYHQSKPNESRDVVIEAEFMREMGRFTEALERMEIAIVSGSARALAIAEAAKAKSTKVCIAKEIGAVIY